MTEKDAIIIIVSQLSILGFFAFILGWRYISNSVNKNVSKFTIIYSPYSSKSIQVTNSPNITTNAPMGAVIYTHINEPTTLNSNP